MPLALVLGTATNVGCCISACKMNLKLNGRTLTLSKKLSVSLSSLVCFPNIRYSHRNKSFNASKFLLTELPELGLCRKFHQNRSSENISNTKLFYIQNPFKWLSTRLDVLLLQAQWDPHFSLNDFMRGAKQAVCTVLTYVVHNENEELIGLIEPKALQDLINDISLKFEHKRGDSLILHPDDIKVSAVQNVRLQTIAEKKYCDIDVGIVALKEKEKVWTEAGLHILMLEILARFYRDYTEGTLPNWTISKLEIKKCTPLVSKSN
ncbi:uncharacterized protein LOC106467973 isoform X2 [Limulus polyphemus]|uniref:Uncharacterized protein LOC106467973 isoform X2 n=1 Tax=Limulus polyphemus TaxID=6850 RepID=A0ABM1BKI8_LIMPO|nr:uncharacterized protein LOC106467973 isoform X2 [Limulus polyphemus]